MKHSIPFIVYHTFEKEPTMPDGYVEKFDKLKKKLYGIPEEKHDSWTYMHLIG